MTNAAPMLGPIIALALWSALIWILMIATRVPAIIKSGMVLDPMVPIGIQMSQLPAKVRWKADNYNHLMEQPTLFYAIALSLALLGGNSTGNLLLAWCYVGLRIIHSLIQITINRIVIRFGVFVISSFVLFVLIYKAAILVF